MTLISMVPSNLSASQDSATYSCTLTNNWSMANHPVDYETVVSDERIPTAAHHTPRVLAIHSEEYQMWAPGKLASDGVKYVAEGGDTAALVAELDGAVDDGFVEFFAIAGAQFNALDPPQTFVPITFTPEFPLLSSVSMLAPTPDWFTGLYGFSPIADGVWGYSFEIAMHPWDAGTQMGDTYAFNGGQEVPPVPIFELTEDTVSRRNPIFLDPSGTDVLPMAFFECTLTNGSPAAPPDGVVMKGAKKGKKAKSSK